MPFAIKHKTKDRYVSNTNSMKADYDDDGLTSLQFARVYPTKSGAKTAMINWASYWDHTVFNEETANLLRNQGAPDDVISLMSMGKVVPNKEMIDLVEIIPIQLST